MRYGMLTVAALLVVGIVAAQDGGRKVSGVVLDASSLMPVAGADVQFEEDSEEGLPPIQTTTTDEKGRFEIASGDTGVVTISAASYGTARRAWPAREGPELRVHMVPPAILSGTVVDLVSGRGVEGVVSLIISNRDNIVSDAVETRGGAYRFEDMPDGQAIVLAKAEGFAPYVSSYESEAGKHVSLRVGLLLEAAATGLVLDNADNPVEGARVIAHYDARADPAGVFSGFAGGVTVTQDDGKFWINGLVPDTSIGLQATLGARASGIVTVRAGPGAVWRDVTLRLP